MTKILKCSCKSVSQDKMYGNGNRVHNEKAKKRKEDPPEYTCTVCSPIYINDVLINMSGQVRGGK